MIFDLNEKVEVKELKEKLIAFMDEVVYPNESVYSEQLKAGESRWEAPPIMEEMKSKAKVAGL